MLDLESVKGIVITQDGQYYPFGKQQSVDQHILKSENYHDTSFNKDIIPQKWFQDLNYKFTLPNMYYHLIRLSAMGLVFILHDVLPPNNPMYTIYTTSNLTDEQKAFFQTNYPYFQSLSKKENTIFEAMAFNHNGNSVWATSIKDLNEFYELLDIQRIHKIK